MGNRKLKLERKRLTAERIQKGLPFTLAKSITDPLGALIDLIPVDEGNVTLLKAMQSVMKDARAKRPVRGKMMGVRLRTREQFLERLGLRRVGGEVVLEVLPKVEKKETVEREKKGTKEKTGKNAKKEG